MIWVTWRQHRQEGLWVLLAVAILAGSTAFITHELSLARCAPQPAAFCIPNDAAGVLAQSLLRFDLVQYGLVVLPALAGAFIGAPLVAREVENGTERLAWTQGVTRSRWLFVKLALVFTPLLAASGLVGFLEVLLINAEGSQANHWSFFDQQAPLTIGATAFAMALGVAVGAVVGKSVPAMAVMLVGFVVTRVGIVELARPHYMNPLVFTTQDPSRVQVGAGPDWWLDLPNLRQQGGTVLLHYQPQDRFWTFQTIETAMLVTLAAILLGFAVGWVTRRVT